MDDKDAPVGLTVILGNDVTKSAKDQGHNIWYLQNDPSNEGALFQVASNFNSLEQTSWYESPQPVMGYFNDHTQGPSAVLCTFPSTLWRRHAWAIQEKKPSPTDKNNYGDYPGVLIKKEVSGVYTGLKTTIGGWLDASSAQIIAPFGVNPSGVTPQVNTPSGVTPQVNTPSGVTPQINTPSPNTITIIDASVGFGSLGVLGCDSLLREDVDEKITILGKPVLVNQMLTSAVDLSDNQKPGSFTGDTVSLFGQASLLAAYCNTLFFAMKNNIKNVYLTLVGGGVFQNRPEIIVYYIIVAMRAMYRLSVRQSENYHQDVKINLVLFNAMAPTTDGKVTLGRVVTETFAKMYPTKWNTLLKYITIV